MRYLPRFFRERIFLSAALRVLCSGASTNILDNAIPNLTSSLQPPHSQPLGGCFLFRLASHAHSLRFPCLHDLLAACTTPAEVIAYTKAASRLPVTGVKTKLVITPSYFHFVKDKQRLDSLTYVYNFTKHGRGICG